MLIQNSKILREDGTPVLLNSHELFKAKAGAMKCFNEFGPVGVIKNALGYERVITTLTTISKLISEQKFYEVASADYVPMNVGEGSFSSNILHYRSFELGDEFETGVINTGGQNSRLAVTDAGVDSLSISIFNWAKTHGWSIFDLELAAKSGNWDLVSAKEKSRKKNWDLGVQRIAFLGMRGSTASGVCVGLLNQPGITPNTVVIPKALSSMTTAELKTFQRTIMGVYRQNNGFTAWPDRLVIPETDYDGLASQASPDFPIKSTLQLLEEAFKLITRKPGFKILPSAYADNAQSGLGVQQYALYNSDPESMIMHIPVDYTNTLANSVDNFSFQNVGYGQVSGLLLLRPLELMYFQYSV